jgi:hypothetical protein
LGLGLRPRPNTDPTDHVPFRIRSVADHVTYNVALLHSSAEIPDKLVGLDGNEGKWPRCPVVAAVMMEAG